MKKYLIMLSLLVLMYLINYNEYNITEDSIRFRVIANSNSIEDIYMKEKVVNELSSIVFNKKGSINEAEKNIYENLETIEDKINNLFESHNYNKSFNISYGLNEIPEKIYRGKKYEKGLYKSLVIEIGNGKGDNYFCVLYPSLCLLDYEKNNSKDKYSFKIVEIIKNIF